MVRQAAEIMRWLNFVVFVIVMLVVQVGAGRVLGLGPGRIMPDLLLMTAVVLAFVGAAEPTPVACWILGFAKDLTSQAPLGSYALAFGLLAVAVLGLRRLLYRENPLTLIVATLLGSVFVEQLVLVICMVKGQISVSQYSGISLAILLGGALTAGLGPYGKWLVLKLRKPLGVGRMGHYGR